MEILTRPNVITGCATVTPAEAISRVGNLLVASGYVTERYVEGMLARDKAFSCAIGNLLAIPHGEKAYKDEILATGLVVMTYPEGIDWNGQTVKMVIGIAARGDEHLELLARIVEVAEDEETVEALVAAGDADRIHKALTQEAAQESPA
jgi:mannitol/fructose-specific phosphotransferase system IIA component